MSHTCIASPFKNQGRCSVCGKFMPKPAVSYSTQTTTTALKPAPVTTVKDDLIVLFRANTCLVGYKDNSGNKLTNMLSLEAKYLTNYVGKGTSKKSDPNTLYLYDIDNLTFRKVNIDTIDSIIPI